MKLVKSIYGLFTALLLSCGFISCDDNDISSDVTEIIYPEYVHLNVSDEWKGYVYTDETGTNVLPLIVGQTAALEYSIPDEATYRDMVWESSDVEVAMVDETGIVKAVASKESGYSIVSVHPEVYFNGSNGLVGSLKVLVFDEVNPVTAVNVTYEERDEYYEGDIIQMNFTLTPADATYRTVKWATSDETIAEIDATGKLTLLKSGHVIVTATSMDDKAHYETEFEVRKGTTPTKVTFSDEMPKEHLAYGQKIDLRKYAVLTPSDAAFSKIEWKDKEGILNVNENGMLSVLYTWDDTKLQMKGHKLTLEASDRNGNKIGEIELEVDPGHFVHFFDDGLEPFYMKWETGTVWQIENDHIHFDCSVSGRQDIGLCNNNTSGYYLNKNTYKYVAVKMRRPYWSDGDQFNGVAPGTPDGWRYNKLALNMNVEGNNLGHQNVKYWLDMTGTEPKLNATMKWDGQPLVYVWTLEDYAGLDSVMDGTGLVGFKNMDIVVADLKIGVSEPTYDIYWIGTFDSLEAIKDFYDVNK